MAAVFIGGVVIIPRIYKKSARELSLPLFKKLCKQTGINATLFLIDKAKPVAFTIGTKVFMSVGLSELLSKKELEAVLLHELHHVCARSSWSKFSAIFVRAFSPIAWFSPYSIEHEEQAADAFAVEIQQTDKYVNSAKIKVDSF